MSRIAEETGIGRATLYRYFPDLRAVLHAWHERQITIHLAELAHLRDRPGSPGERLEAVLTGYAFRSGRSHGPHDCELAVLLHSDDEALHATGRLHDMLEQLIDEGARSGDLRADVPATELATFCLHALAGSGSLTSDAAVHRLVDVTLAGLRSAR